MERAMGKINFLRRGIISILIGSLVLVVGLAFYFELNAGTRFLIIILGFSLPFFFIGVPSPQMAFYEQEKETGTSITNNLTMSG
jgi:energy-coupling factor transporter transmembrane protein EcfT